MQYTIPLYFYHRKHKFLKKKLFHNEKYSLITKFYGKPDGNS
jgi:hypothetical protein